LFPEILITHYLNKQSIFLFSAEQELSLFSIYISKETSGGMKSLSAQSLFLMLDPVRRDKILS
jgi:hypothetical protein